jgi:SIR2-like domain
MTPEPVGHFFRLSAIAMPPTDFDSTVKFIQQQFTDGLVLVVGSGLSAAEGLPGMHALADHLKKNSSDLNSSDLQLWQKIAAILDANEGLEAALLRHTPTETLEAWIAERTADLILPREREVLHEVLRGNVRLRLTDFLNQVLRPPNGLPILTPNYDRLVEIACEMAGFHVDTTAIGHYAGAFDHSRSCMSSCRGITPRGKSTVLEHYPRAIVLKPHGSFDWYRNGTNAVRCSIDLDLERLIITPGLNKYRAGYDIPFDKHRELANNHINRCARLFVVGYGFNDDHLQTHLEKRIRDGTPTLIITRTPSKKARALAVESPNCVCLAKPTVHAGVTITTNGTSLEMPGLELWDLGILTKELLT